MEDNFAAGDFVVLGNTVKAEFKGAAAIILDVTPLDCTVAVLDPSRTYKIGECQANFRAMRTIHRDWRLGTRHVIGGLQSSKMQHLNGLVATVREHRRYGHPCFLLKEGGKQGDNRLRLCVRWELANDVRTSTGALLLEPRFLSLYVRELQGPPEGTPQTHGTESRVECREEAAPTPNTLLTSKRCPCLEAVEGKHRSVELSSTLQAIDEMEPSSHLTKASYMITCSPCKGTRHMYVFAHCLQDHACHMS